MTLRQRIRRAVKVIGPGVVTGGSDNDPAGIVTYTTVGALFGYALLWVMILLTPLMIVVQEMAGRVALVKKQGLARIIKDNYGYNLALVSVLILVIANIATIAADLAGVAATFGLLFGVSFLWFIIPVALGVTLLMTMEDYRHFRRLLLSLTALLVLYIISALLAHPNWASVAEGFLPTWHNNALFIGAIIAIIGTTISPYMLFWQASEEVEDHKKFVDTKELNIDTIIGMSWSNLVAIFIIIAAGITLYASGIEIQSVATAALALRPIAGDWAFLLFSVGLIASGFLALPVLAGSTAYAVAELFNWREGFTKLHLAKGFYWVIIFSMIFGALIAYLPINPIDFLYYTQILNGFLTPFLIFMLLVLCNNSDVVGPYVNSPIKNFIGIVSLLVLIALDIFLLIDIFKIF